MSNVKLKETPTNPKKNPTTNKNPKTKPTKQNMTALCIWPSLFQNTKSRQTLTTLIHMANIVTVFSKTKYLITKHHVLFYRTVYRPVTTIVEIDVGFRLDHVEEWHNVYNNVHLIIYCLDNNILFRQ